MHVGARSNPIKHREMEFPMTVSTTAVDTLANLVEDGAFTSRLESYIESRIRRSNTETFYSRIIAESGYDAAERQLTEWIRSLHYDVFSATVESVTRGILALAKAKPDLLTDITNIEASGHQPIDNRFGPRRKFVMFNTQARGCGCSQPKGNYLFGPYGELGLKAVVLETGYAYDGPRTTLQLVLPAWGKSHNPPSKGEFVVVKIESSGSSDGEKYSPYTSTEQGTQDFTDVDAALNHLLGIQRLDHIGIMMTASSIDQVIGFPGAEDYLAAKLPDLGDYFIALAEKLSNTHAH